MEYNGVRKIILRPDLQGVTLVAPKGSPTAQPISWADQTLSTTIMSTTLGVMTCEQAKAYKIGGLPLLTVGPPRA
jgi:ribosomal protein S8